MHPHIHNINFARPVPNKAEGATRAMLKEILAYNEIPLPRSDGSGGYCYESILYDDLRSRDYIKVPPHLQKYFLYGLTVELDDEAETALTIRNDSDIAHLARLCPYGTPCLAVGSTDLGRQYQSIVHLYKGTISNEDWGAIRENRQTAFHRRTEKDRVTTNHEQYDTTQDEVVYDDYHPTIQANNIVAGKRKRNQSIASIRSQESDRVYRDTVLPAKKPLVRIDLTE